MRIAFNAALIFSLLYAPWWATAVILVCACFIVEGFYESVFYGILVDAMYGTRFGIHGFAYAGSLFALAAFVVSSLLRKRMAW